MSPTPTTVELAAALAEVVPVLARTLPSPTGFEAGEPVGGDGPRDELLPGPDARAVTATLTGGLQATVVLAVSAELAAAIEDGPLGAQELAPALEPTIDVVAGGLEPLGDGPVVVEVLQEVAADVALGDPDDGRALAAVPLFAGTEHVGTLAVLIPAPDAASGAAQPAVDLERDLRSESQRLARDNGARRPLELLADVEMAVTAELGRTRMTLGKLLSLAPGALIELDRSAGSPVDVLVNGKVVARGEVVVIDEEFGIRISEIVGQVVEAAGTRN